MTEGAAMLGLGVVQGTTGCGIGCLSSVGPYLLGRGGGFRQGIHNLLCFLLGKTIMYTLLAGGAAWFGRALQWDDRLAPLNGLLFIVIGLSLLYTGRNHCRNHCPRRPVHPGLLLLGASTSAAACPPLAAVLSLAVGADSVAAGASYGLFFGLGLTVSPILLAGGALAFFGRRLGREAGNCRPYIRCCAAAIMVVLGLRIWW